MSLPTSEHSVASFPGLSGNEAIHSAKHDSRVSTFFNTSLKLSIL